MMNDQQPQQAPPVQTIQIPVGVSKTMVTIATLLASAIGAAGHYVYNEQTKGDATLPEDALILPAEIHLKVGNPELLRADTVGKNIQWLTLDAPVKWRRLDAKSVWVYANKPGKFQMLAWTAVNGWATPYAATNVIVTVDTEDSPPMSAAKKD